MPRVLGMETSCDETAVAILEGETDGEIRVVEHVVASQIPEHAAYGGVVPEVAARLHAEVLPRLFEHLHLSDRLSEIDLIAVTKGPGLAPALRVGVEATKMLHVLTGIPLVGVNHLEGHLVSPWLPPLGAARAHDPAFPLLSLIVSGGHTEWVLIKKPGDYTILGQTRDDAAGEAFDKVAKRLGLSYPGGPEVSRLAQMGKRDAILFPRPMLDSQSPDVSFSGLKTAVAVYLDQHPETSKEDLCASFEEAVVETLMVKTERLLAVHRPKAFSIVGGVSANTHLRAHAQRLSDHTGIPVLFPERTYTGDNAAMIALAGLWKAHYQQTLENWRDIRATPTLPL